MNVLDFAMKMELQGKAFYQNLADSASHPGLKTIFTGLAADEQKHYELFRDLKEGKGWSMSNSVMLDEAKTVFQNFIANRELIESQLREDGRLRHGAEDRGGERKAV